MDLRTDADFVAWLRERGIGADPRYPRADSLVFLDSPDVSRFWLPHGVPSDLPDFLLTALRAVSASGPYWLWKRGGGPWYHGEHASSREEIIDRLIGTLGIPHDFAGAIGFGADDWNQILSVLIPFYVFGWHVGNDVYVVPENREGLLMLGHHGELDGFFRNDGSLQQFTASMAAKGFHLPDDVPDPTFKRPSWMVLRGTA